MRIARGNPCIPGAVLFLGIFRVWPDVECKFIAPANNDMFLILKVARWGFYFRSIPPRRIRFAEIFATNVADRRDQVKFIPSDGNPGFYRFLFSMRSWEIADEAGGNLTTAKHPFADLGELKCTERID